MKPFRYRSLILVAIVTFAHVVAAQPPAVRKSPPPAVPEGVKAYRDLAYVTAGHDRQRLDLYVPQAATQPLPVIVWITADRRTRLGSS